VTGIDIKLMNINYNYQKNNPVDLLYILGAGHCGSTLLNLCLDRHSSVFGVSEIISLNQKSPGWSGNKYILTDPFWSKVDRYMHEQYSEKLSKVSFNLKKSTPSYDLAIKRNKAALDSILKISGKKIICDASKNYNRLNVLLESKLFRVRVIYLVRDGRAIVHAYRRKYGSWWPGLYNLMRTDHASRQLMNKFGSKNWLIVRYEDLATDFEPTLAKICNFAKIKFESQMLYPDTSTYNGLGGNRLINRPIQEIKLDNAWETEMPTMVRSLTTLTVSNYNRRHGYRS